MEHINFVFHPYSNTCMTHCVICVPILLLLLLLFFDKIHSRKKKNDTLKLSMLEISGTLFGGWN